MNKEFKKLLLFEFFRNIGENSIGYLLLWHFIGIYGLVITFSLVQLQIFYPLIFLC